MLPLEGGCSCRTLRYRLTAAPLFIHCCHCRDCQRQTGSAFAVNALIELDCIDVVSGELVAHEMPTDSGRPHDVYRCAGCGTALWSDYGRRGYLKFVRVGTLDTPDALAPDVHIYTRSKLPWVQLPGGARAFEEFYDIRKEWPMESQARRKRASEKAQG